MAVNRFSTPVQSTYMSQYVPIPFEQLYALGKEYNARVDKAYNTLNEQVSKWTDFQSPSAVDTARWNELTLEPAKELVDRLAANPDLIKTAAGRAEIQSFINSRPYGELNALKQSRDNMLQRQKLEQQLSLAGKYNPLWHQVDYTDYSTTNGGIFDDLNLVPYVSEVDLVKPYVSSLKDSFLKSVGGYDYVGVTPEMTDQQVKENISAIYNTPEAQMHIQALMKQGMTRDEANQAFVNSVYQAGRQYSRINREANAFSLLNAKIQASSKGKADKETPKVAYLTDQLEYAGMTAFQNGKMQVLSNTEEYKKLREQLNSKDKAVQEQAKKQLADLYNNTSYRDLFNKVATKNMYSGTSSPESLMYLTNETVDFTINEIMNTFGTEVRNAKVNELLQDAIPNITSDYQTTPLGKKKVIQGGQNLQLFSSLVYNTAGLSFTGKDREKVEEALASGKISNMIVLGNNRILPIPTSNNRTVQYQEVKVAIPADEIRRLGIDDISMKSAGGVKIDSDKARNISESTTISGELNNDDELRDRKTSKTKSIQDSNKEYWVVSLANRLPLSGEGLNAEALNQQYLKQSISSTGSTEMYPDVQNISYNLN